MPVYEYKREDGTVFEFTQKITEPALETCPTTGQKVERLISISTAILKGTGWFKTDYCQKSSAKESKNSSE